MPDAWSNAATYEHYVGRWSRRLAPAFVKWVGVRAGARVLEVGSGTGALSEAILARRPALLAGFDLAPAYVEETRRRLPAANARFDVADAQALPVADATFDVALSGLVLNFVPDPSKMLGEMRRALVPGGVAALYVWDYAGKMEFVRHFWNAAVALDPAAAKLDAGVRFPMCNPAALAKLFEAAGLTRVETRPVDQPTVFRDFEDYWTPFLGGQGPAGGYCVALDPKRREALRDHVRRGLPTRPDGTIPLVARAWAVKGVAP